MANTKRVTLARAYTDAEGRSYGAGETAALELDEARNLLSLGLAREPDPEPEPEPDPEPEPEPSRRAGAKRASKRSTNKEGA